jgi:hypothetical protein
MRKLLLIAAAASALLATACSKPDLMPVKGPDGHEWVAITCSRNARSCWKAAGEFCPNGYESADEVTSTTHGLLFSTHMRDEMLIRCKGPESAAAEAPPRALRRAPPADE